MELLALSDYSLLQPLVSYAPHDLAVAAIAASRAAGKVFVDDPGHPQLALVSPHWGRLYLLGAAGPQAATALNHLLDAVVVPGARSAGAKVFTLACPPGWQPYLPAVMAGIRVTPAQRQYYRWAGGDYPQRLPPAGFALLPADAGLLARREIGNLELLREEITSERASVEDFLARSFGIAALHGNQLAGWCLSEYNTGARCEVGIAALEPFQRRGLAAALGAAFLDMARSQGIAEVGWHCWTENFPSAATALRIGLEHVADYPVHLGWYDEADAPR